MFQASNMKLLFVLLVLVALASCAPNYQKTGRCLAVNRNCQRSNDQCCPGLYCEIIPELASVGGGYRCMGTGGGGIGL